MLETEWSQSYIVNRLIVNRFISKNEDYSPIFSMAEVPLNGIDPLARCCTLAFSVRNVPFLGAQTCFTCTCKAAWDVHVVQCSVTTSLKAVYGIAYEGFNESSGRTITEGGLKKRSRFFFSEKRLLLILFVTSGLLTQSKSFDDSTISFDIFCFQIVE